MALEYILAGVLFVAFIAFIVKKFQASSSGSGNGGKPSDDTPPNSN